MSTASTAGNGAHSGGSGSSKLWSGHGVGGGGGEASSASDPASKPDDHLRRSGSGSSTAPSRSAAGPSSRVHYRDRNDRPADEKDGKRARKAEYSSSSSSRNHTTSTGSKSKTNGAAAAEVDYSKYDDKHGHYVINLGDALGEDNRYKMLDILGEGTFGKVVEAFDRTKRCRLAIKIIKSVPKYRHAAKIELRVLEKLRASGRGRERFCVHLIGMIDFRNHICMLFEKLGLSIYDFMSKEKYRPFCIEEVRHFAYQILIALEFIHDCGLTHTDLKPENIMLDDCTCAVKGKRRVLQNTKITVIDFGSATFENEHHTKIVSTRHYRAPEVILELGWSHECDLWSLGCILVELKTGQVIFQTHDNMEHLAIMDKTLGTIPSKLAKQCRRTSTRDSDSDSRRNFFDRDLRLNWNGLSEESNKYVRDDIVSLERMVKPRGTPEHDFLDLMKRLLEYDRHKRLSARKSVNEPFIKAFQKDEHKGFLRDRIARLLQDGYQLEVVT